MRFYLLAYLLCQDEWVGRERLSYLFWPDSPTPTARHNLRQLLRRVRALPWLVGMEGDERRLRWRVESDVAAFKRALLDSAWDRAMVLYGGPLMEGLSGDNVPEFGRWLEFERAQLRDRWRELLLDQAARLTHHKQHRRAVKVLANLLHQDEFDEEALRAYMTASVHAGRQRHALEAYQGFARRLQDELGLVPTTDTQRLAQLILTGNLAELPVPDPPPSDASAPPARHLPGGTTFVGRVVELAELANLLANPACRLLTIVGLGGVGKSSLALAASQELGPRYSDGVVFVSLEALTQAEGIPSALVDALGIKLAGATEPLYQVVQFIGARKMLLVLDNFEHVLDGAVVASDLLRRCPNLELLATSREPLNLDDEWLLPLPGLAYPRDEVALEDAYSYDALRLFVQRAERARPGYQLSATELPAVLRICRLVDGLPLALELATHWLRTLGTNELAEELSRSLDVLTSRHRNAPARHYSVRATFEHSHKLLTQEEQAVLRRLAVFRGGFTRQAAAVVAEAKLPLLAALLDKSLLRVTAQGRYDRHPLLYQYTQDKLAENPQEMRRVQEKHGLHFLRLLESWGAESASFREPAVLPTFNEELENIRAAWLWAVSDGRFREIETVFIPLVAHYEMNARYRAGLELLAEAHSRLREDPQHQGLRAHLEVQRASLGHWIGRYQEATELANQGVAALRSLRDQVGVRRGLSVLGNIALRSGDYPTAKTLYAEALDLSGDSGLHDKAGLLNSLAISDWHLGDYAAAKSGYEQSLGLSRELGDRLLTARTLSNLATLHMSSGAPLEAERYLREALQLAREAGARHRIPYLLYNLGAAVNAQGRHAEARAYFEETLGHVRESGNQSLEAGTLALLGRVAADLGHYGKAVDYLEKGLTLAWQIQSIPAVLEALLWLGNLRLKQGRDAEAASLLGFLLHHEKSHQPVKDYARTCLAQLHATASTDRQDQTAGLGRALELSEVVENALRQLQHHS